MILNFFPLLLSQIELQSMRVDCKVASRFAHTTMTTKALNAANDSQEVFFEVDLPKTAFITNFSMSVPLCLLLPPVEMLYVFVFICIYVLERLRVECTSVR